MSVKSFAFSAQLAGAGAFGIPLGSEWKTD